MTYSLEICYNGLPSSLKTNYPIPVKVNSDSTEEILSAIKQERYQKIVKMAFKEGVANICFLPEVARVISEYYRSDSTDPKNPFMRKANWIIDWLVGKDSIITCASSLDNKELRGYLIDFLNSLTEEGIAKLSHRYLVQQTQNWRGNVNLNEQISLLIAKIGIEGVMGFREEAIQTISESMAYFELSEPVGFVSTCIRKLRELLKSTKIKNAVTKEVQFQIENGCIHPFLQKMCIYARRKNNLSTDQALNAKAIKTIVENYIVILNAIQAPTSSYLRHMLWDLAKRPDEQDCLSQKSSQAESFYLNNDLNGYLTQLKSLKEALTDGLNRFSPGGIGRNLKYDLIFHDGDFQFPIKVDELIIYLPAMQARVENETTNSQKAYHFGAGKHVCPGKKFAEKIIEVCFAYLLAMFSFRTKQKTLKFYEGRVLTTAEDIIVQVESRLQTKS